VPPSFAGHRVLEGPFSPRENKKGKRKGKPGLCAVSTCARRRRAVHTSVLWIRKERGKGATTRRKGSYFLNVAKELHAGKKGPLSFCSAGSRGLRRGCRLEKKDRRHSPIVPSPRGPDGPSHEENERGKKLTSQREGVFYYFSPFQIDSPPREGKKMLFCPWPRSHGEYRKENSSDFGEPFRVKEAAPSPERGGKREVLTLSQLRPTKKLKRVSVVSFSSR